MSTVAKIQNNEFPGFYSEVAQIDHPLWKEPVVANLIRHYTEEDPNAVGSFLVFNEVQKIYERIVVEARRDASRCWLIAYRPNSDRGQRQLGDVDFSFIEVEYGPELPDGKRRSCLRIYVRDLKSFNCHLRGLGTQLMQAALQYFPQCEGRMALQSAYSLHPNPHAFYYKLGMRWADRPNVMDDKTLDYDARILKEIEDARKEGRKADTSKIGVPHELMLYFPDDAIKVWQEVIEKRPVLYPTDADLKKRELAIRNSSAQAAVAASAPVEVLPWYTCMLNAICDLGRCIVDYFCSLFSTCNGE